MVVIRAPRHRPPRPSTIGYSDRDAALALRSELASLMHPPSVPHQQQDCQERRAEHGTDSTVAGWYNESSIKPYFGPSFLLVASARGAGPGSRPSPTRRTVGASRRCGRRSPTGTRPTGHGFALRTREDSESCLGRATRAVHPREVPSPAGPRDPQDLDWSRESSASQRTSVRMRSAKKTLWALCTAIPIQALR